MDRPITERELRAQRDFFVDWMRREHPDMTDEEIIKILAEPWDNVHKQIFGEMPDYSDDRPEWIRVEQPEMDRFYEDVRQLTEGEGKDRTDAER